MVHHQCGFFHVSLNGLILNSHTGSNWMIYHCCGSFQVSSKCLMLNIFCHSESSWMVYHQCGLFHVSSNGLILNIWSATRSKWMFFTGVNSFMSLQIAWCWGMGATEWCITFVGSFLCKFKINSCVLSSMLKTELTYRYKVLFLIMTQTYQSFHMPSKKLS